MKSFIKNLRYIKMAAFITVVFLTAISGKTVFPQALPEGIGGALGVYMMNVAKKPKEFENFENIVLEEFPAQENVNVIEGARGQILIDGELTTNDRLTYKFKTAFFRRIKRDSKKLIKNIGFETISIEGIRYKFEGAFVEKFYTENGQYTAMRGTLIKYKNGKIVAKKIIPFYHYGEV